MMMKERDMKKTAILYGVGLLGLAATAWAGLAVSRETQVDLVARTANGSIRDTRASADTVQYLSCFVSISAPGAAAVAYCDARDAASERLICSVADPAFVQLAQSISAVSYVSFTCDASGHLTSLTVNSGSQWMD
jgi:hypothetical protein